MSYHAFAAPLVRRAQRLAEGNDWTPWGIRFLDEATLGFSLTDLTLLGAYTGVGKTQIAAHVAFHAAKQGKQVLFFALEAEDQEIEDRIIWSHLVREYLSKHPFGKPGVDLRYREWRKGNLDAELGDLEGEVYEGIKFTLANIQTRYRGSRFTVDDFERNFDACAPDASLIIVDHMHYFDLEDDNELRGLKTATRKIRDAALRNRKPVLLLAHLRKAQRGEKSPIPDIDDFHGSSDLCKIATDVVIAARADDVDPRGGGRATWLYIAKSRQSGDAQGYAGLVSYDVSKGLYGTDYLLARVRRFSEPEFLQASARPRWAKSAKECPV